MIIKKLIQSEIDKIPEEQLEELYQLIKDFTTQKNNWHSQKRSTPVHLKGKVKILGDIVSPIIDEEDWECLK